MLFVLFTCALANASVVEPTTSDLNTEVGQFLNEAIYCSSLTPALDPQGRISANADAARRQLVGFLGAAFPENLEAKVRQTVTGGFTYGPYTYSKSDIVKRGYYYLGVATAATVACAEAMWPDAKYEMMHWQSMLMSGYQSGTIHRFLDAANACMHDHTGCVLPEEERLRRQQIKDACISSVGKMAKFLISGESSFSKVLGFSETHEPGCRVSVVTPNFSGVFFISQGYTITPLRVIQNLEIATPEELAAISAESIELILTNGVNPEPKEIEKSASLAIAASQAGHLPQEAVDVVIESVKRFATTAQKLAVEELSRFVN